MAKHRGARRGNAGSGAAPAKRSDTGPTTRANRLNPLTLGALAVLVAGAFFFASAVLDDDGAGTGERTVQGSEAAHPAEAQAGGPRAFAYFENVEDARPLPVTLPPDAWDHPTLVEAYGIAREIPEVLAQLPCLCGCDRMAENHRSLLDCFVDDHAAT